jgi:hypothetical protein
MSNSSNFATPHTIQPRLASLLARIDEVAAQGKSTEWPHCHHSDTTREYVGNVSELARQLVATAAQDVRLPPSICDKPVTELHEARLKRHFHDTANQRGIAANSMSEATFAACECKIRMAANLVAHLEACLRDEQTITGMVINRGELWEK